MKRTVKLAILGAMLQSGVQAAAQDIAAKPALSTARHTLPAQPVAKKQKAVRSKKHKAARSGKVKPKPRLQAEPVEHAPTVAPEVAPVEVPTPPLGSVQVKGVRG